jgi:hypothetical protein
MRWATTWRLELPFYSTPDSRAGPGVSQQRLTTVCSPAKTVLLRSGAPVLVDAVRTTWVCNGIRARKSAFDKLRSKPPSIEAYVWRICNNFEKAAPAVTRPSSSAILSYIPI